MASEEEVILNEISALREELKDLRERRAEVASEIRTLKQERRELIEKIKGLREELRAEREKLAKLKEERQKLIEERREAVKKIREIKSQLFSKRELLNNAGKVEGMSVAKIRARIDRLEWRIITESLPLEEENAIIREISRLESLLEKAVEARKLRNEYRELNAQLKSQIIILNDLNGKISELSIKINSVRERIGTLKEQVKALQESIEERNKAIQDRANELVELSGKLNEMYAKYREFQTRLRELRVGRKKAVEKEIIERKKEGAMKKLKEGKRLTLEDLKVLYGGLEEEE
ncbi:MAG: hypothetical protein J7L55_02420 [Desulfurococcales archaeon]|nr:hypothetical protein [Desulfurococcales archaeon]